MKKNEIARVRKQAVVQKRKQKAKQAFADQVASFIRRYRSALEALVKR